MARAHTRLGLLLIGVGVAIIPVLFWVPRFVGKSRSASRDDSREPAAAEVHLEGGAPARSPARPPTEPVEDCLGGEVPSDEEAEDLRDPRTDSLTACWIDITVSPSEGTPATWTGTAYLLASGSRGVERVEEVPHAKVNVGDVSRIPVAVEGAYDVGLVSDAIQLLQRDVAVKRGENRVDLRLPPLAPVRFRLDRAFPPDEPNARTSGFVHLERDADVSRWRDYPGREDVRRSGPLLLVRGADAGELSSEPVPVGEAWLVDVEMRETRTTAGGHTFDFSPRWELTADKKTVSAGDIVDLSVHPKGRVRLELKASESPWPGLPGKLDITFVRRHDGDSWGLGRYVSDAAALAALCTSGAERALGPGVWDIKWEGPGFEEGALPGVEVVGNTSVARRSNFVPLSPILPLTPA